MRSRPRETLEERIHALEHRLLPTVVRDASPRPNVPMRALDLGPRQARHRQLRRGPRRARLRARLLGRYGVVSRRARPGGDASRGRHGGARGARRAGEDSSSAHPRRHPRATRARGGSRDAGRAGDRAVRPRLRQPLPFGSVAGRAGVEEADIIEMIDVGGPALVRAAAKNFAHVAVVCRPEQYDPVLAELREGSLSPETRRALAAEAFAMTAAYDAAIARWFAETQYFPDQLTLTFRKVTDLAYGENPHQTAAYYEEVGREPLLYASASSAGASSPTTTSPTSRPRAGSLASSRAGGRDRQAREPLRGGASRRRSRRPTNSRSRPTRFRRSAA